MIDSTKILDNYLYWMDVGPDDKHVFRGDINLDHLKPQIENAYEDCLNDFSLKCQNNLESTRQTIFSKNCKKSGVLKIFLQLLWCRIY